MKRLFFTIALINLSVGAPGNKDTDFCFVNSAGEIEEDMHELAHSSFEKIKHAVTLMQAHQSSQSSPTISDHKLIFQQGLTGLASAMSKDYLPAFGLAARVGLSGKETVIRQHFISTRLKFLEVFKPFVKDYNDRENAYKRLNKQQDFDTLDRLAILLLMQKTHLGSAPFDDAVLFETYKINALHQCIVARKESYCKAYDSRSRRSLAFQKLKKQKESDGLPVPFFMFRELVHLPQSTTEQDEDFGAFLEKHAEYNAIYQELVHNPSLEEKAAIEKGALAAKGARAGFETILSELLGAFQIWEPTCISGATETLTEAMTEELLLANSLVSIEDKQDSAAAALMRWKQDVAELIPA